jgi:ACS family sodium-dependent inorganic phosphate cotransporter
MLRSFQQRYWLVGMSALAVFICYIDRVNISVAIIPMADTHGWSPQTQGLVLSSFFVGYLLLQIVGGRLSDRFGGKVVLGWGVLLWSLFTILTPAAASASIAVLIATRILMGMGEAVTYPSIYSLFVRWLPTAERGRAMGLTNSGIPIGTAFALIVTPLIVKNWGWEWAFYSFGVLGIIWFVIWQFSVSHDPAHHPLITEAELAHIQHDGEHESDAPAPSISAFLKSKAIWAIIVAHFCNNWSLYLLLSWLPTYINKGLGVDYASVGLFTMVPFLVSFVFYNLAGSIADRMISGGMPVGKVRKIMQSISAGSMTLTLLVVGYSTNVWMAIAIMSVGNALGSFAIGGFVVNHMDVAPRHAGTVMGITNTFATIPGIIGVYAAGAILELTNSWLLVFQIAAGVTFFGLLFYLAFASSEREFD